jgi:hypothetical protein
MSLGRLTYKEIQYTKMTATELNNIISGSVLSQEDWAKIIGVTGRTMRRYVTNNPDIHSEIPTTVAALFRLIDKGKISVKDVMNA